MWQRKWIFKSLSSSRVADHVHALIEEAPKLSISQIVNSLKGVSSPQYGSCGYTKPYGKDARWSPSYFVSSVGGAPIQVLKKYIRAPIKAVLEGRGFQPNFLINVELCFPSCCC